MSSEISDLCIFYFDEIYTNDKKAFTHRNHVRKLFFYRNEKKRREGRIVALLWSAKGQSLEIIG